MSRLCIHTGKFQTRNVSWEDFVQRIEFKDYATTIFNAALRAQIYLPTVSYEKDFVLLKWSDDSRFLHVYIYNGNSKYTLGEQYSEPRHGLITRLDQQMANFSRYLYAQCVGK